MRAKFQYITAWSVCVTCQTPLRTGDAENSPDEILLDSEGTPILMGTSVAGAMREYVARSVSGHAAEELFGAREQEGRLSVYGIAFDLNPNGEPLQLIQRPRVRLDGKTRTAADTAKFEIAGIPAGATGHFSILLRGQEPENDKEKQVEAFLSAIHYGEISFGSQKSNGFGRLSVSYAVKHFDLRPENGQPAEDLRAWIRFRPEQKQDGEYRTPERENGQYATFRVSLTTPGLIVKDTIGRGQGAGSTDYVNLQENGRYILPGSSIKGMLRAQCEKIADYLQLGEDCIRGAFGSDAAERDKERLCAGAIRVTDGIFEQKTVTTHINRIRIDRLTGGVMTGALFAEEPVSGSVAFSISLPEQQSAACGLVLYALRDLALGLTSLGGDSTIGLGRVAKMTVRVNAEGRNAEMKYSNTDSRIETNDSKGLFGLWFGALEAEHGKE